MANPRNVAGQVRLDSPCGRWVLVATVLGSSVAMLTGTVVNVALPTLGSALSASTAQLQWVLNGYLLALASLILIGGSLGDRYGHRRMFVLGTVWFTVASILCAFAPDIQWLIGFRVLQGVGAAMLMPESLAIIQAVYHPDDRGRAIGSWVGARRHSRRRWAATRRLADRRDVVAIRVRSGRPPLGGRGRRRTGSDPQDTHSQERTPRHRRVASSSSPASGP